MIITENMLITDKQELKKYASEHRLWQGIPGLEVTKGGRIFSAFYSGGTREQIGNYMLLLKSDDGVNFTEPIAVAYKEGSRCYDGGLWIDPLGRLWFFWSVMPEHGVYAVICDDPDAEELTWGKQIYIGRDIMLNKPTILSTGEWLFPVAVWDNGVRVLSPEYDTEMEEKGSYVYKSVDNGQTFEKLGYADVPNRCFDEHMTLELNDGRLAIYVRTFYGIGVSYSYDRGKTWTKGVDSGLGGPGSRFHIRRLKSGRILLVNHVNFTGRNNLTALLSEDDGKTWKYQLLLDGRKDVSYPDVVEAEDGYLYITYDRERGGFKSSLEEVYADAREVLYAKITEADIMAGELVSEESKLQCIISKLGKYADEHENPFQELTRYSDEEFAEILVGQYPDDIVGKIFEQYPLKCVDMQKPERDQLDELIERVGLQEEEGAVGNRETTDAEQKQKNVLEVIRFARTVTSDNDDSLPMVARIKEILLDNPAEELPMQELADRVGVSKYYMLHLFKKMTGITITYYRNELKIARAKRLLVSSDKTMTEIAQDCGFGDSSYFSKIFMRHEKVSPTEYRSRLKNQGTQIHIP